MLLAYTENLLSVTICVCVCILIKIHNENTENVAVTFDVCPENISYVIKHGKSFVWQIVLAKEMTLFNIYAILIKNHINSLLGLVIRPF